MLGERMKLGEGCRDVQVPGSAAIQRSDTPDRSIITHSFRTRMWWLQEHSAEETSKSQASSESQTISKRFRSRPAPLQLQRRARRSTPPPGGCPPACQPCIARLRLRPVAARASSRAAQESACCSTCMSLALGRGWPMRYVGSMRSQSLVSAPVVCSTPPSRSRT